jgi:purine nucleosidase
MTRKLIIDCDPGIDDAIALSMALFDPRLEVLAVTATAGTIAAERATTNVQALIERLDPPRFPRLGAASDVEGGPVLDDAELHGPDGLAGCNFTCSDRQHRAPSEKVIAELVRRYPNEVTIVCLGPLTNLARAIQRDPSLCELIHKVMISGGTVTAPGNVTPAAEFNMYFDPASARRVFHSPITKSLVPLDVTERLMFGLDLIDELPSKLSRVGALLHRLVPFAFRAQHVRLGRESLPLYDPIAMIATVEPEMFEWQEMIGDVELEGQVCRGATVFDRRQRPQGRSNMEVATQLDVAGVRQQILRGLRFAGQESA